MLLINRCLAMAYALMQVCLLTGLHLLRKRQAVDFFQYHAGHCQLYTKKAQSFDWALFLIGVWQ